MQDKGRPKKTDDKTRGGGKTSLSKAEAERTRKLVCCLYVSSVNTMQTVLNMFKGNFMLFTAPAETAYSFGRVARKISRV